MKHKVLLIFLLALAVRIFYILAVPPRPMTWDDSMQWNQIALKFMEGKGFSDGADEISAIRPPLYPLFIAAVYLVCGRENFRAVKIAQSVLDALTCVLVFYAAFLVFGAQTALLSGVVMALYPPLISYTEILMSETLSIFLLALMVNLWLRSVRDTKWIFFISAGIVLGLHNLCRGTLLFFPFLALATAAVIKEERKKFAKILILVLVSFSVIAPWSWRNFKVYSQFVPVAFGGAEHFWFGTLPIKEQKQSGNAAAYRALELPKDPIESERKLKELALENIRKDPLSYICLTAQKFFYFWFEPVGYKLISQRSKLLGVIDLAAHFALVALFIVGLIFTRGQGAKLLPIYLLILYYMALHIVLNPMPRYRLPIEPFVVLFAADAVQRLLSQVRPSKKTCAC